MILNDDEKRDLLKPLEMPYTPEETKPEDKALYFREILKNAGASLGEAFLVLLPWVLGASIVATMVVLLILSLGVEI